MPELTVRPLPRGTPAASPNIFTVYLAEAYLERHRLQLGSVCEMRTADGPIGSVIVRKSPDLSIKLSVIQTSQALQSIYGLKLGDKVALKYIKSSLQSALVISVAEVRAEANGSSRASECSEETHAWRSSLRAMLQEAEVFSPGLKLHDVAASGCRKTYEVLDIDGEREIHLFRIDADFEIRILESIESLVPNVERPLNLPRDGIGGLQVVLNEVDQLLSEFDVSRVVSDWSSRILRPQQGILLHGVSGTGKSLLLHSVANAGWRKCLSFDGRNPSNRLPSAYSNIKDKFEDARRYQPSVILIDNLELLAPNESSEAVATSAAYIIRAGFDTIAGSRVLVVATTRNVAAVDESLRDPDYFLQEIELPVPDIAARTQILRTLGHELNEKLVSQLSEIAACTHGFVGRDLLRLVKFAREETKARVARFALDGRDNGDGNPGLAHAIEKEDFLKALRHVRPSAMREIFVETPQTKFRDICGQEAVKKDLQKAIIWPHKFPIELALYRSKERKGLLLYGPPGCSKTMAARAAATESGLNFIAVKGAELLSMYVGESERAIRDLFRKARAVSPSIIFFDEIDAIGSRSGGHGGVHTVTTLLNELDGVNQLTGIFVLAATNRPETLDPALTRAGRFDTMVYVGPPDQKARQQILQDTCQELLLDQDVRFIELAQRTKGYSGAEMVEICQKAGDLAFEAFLESGEKRGITHDQLLQAVLGVAKSITTQMERSYELFRSSHGGPSLLSSSNASSSSNDNGPTFGRDMWDP